MVSSRFAWKLKAATCCIAVPLVAAAAGAQTVAPMYGNIAPFYGNIAPFYGNIAPFYGNIAPFYGNIAPFYGNIAPFWGSTNPFVQATDAATIATYGSNYDAFWGANGPYTLSAGKLGLAYRDIAGFWSTQAASFNALTAAWASASSAGDFAAVAGQLQSTILDPAQRFWGTAVGKAIKNGTVSSVYANRLLADAGVAFNADGSINAASLQGVSPTQQAWFFLRLYDSLMTHAGTAHVDWWMGATGWSPALAVTQGTAPKGGNTPTVGMLDFAISAGQATSKQILQYGGSVTNGHGAAVGSLIIGSVDGSGIMGVMPAGSGNVVVYNPYDATGTTNWTDVGTGIAKLATSIFPSSGAPVGVLNASLGVPGWTLHPGWNDALSSGKAAGHNLVIAAGNEGVTQTANVPWDFAKNPTILIVGSVGVDGTISNFSNRPGEACLLPGGTDTCSEANKLKYRFLVAPGELILVSDGQGGFTRQTGTSLAAPLVSGAITLLQNRWPWLANYPNETAQIILRSATPLGSRPGADPDYGVGELNIRASQSPLDWTSLKYYTAYNGVVGAPVSYATVLSQVRSGTSGVLGVANQSLFLFETVGNTFRDFEVPLASKLVGQTVATAAGGQLYQSFLVPALRAQAGLFATPSAPYGGLQRLGLAASGVPTGQLGAFGMTARVAPRQVAPGFLMGQNRFETDLAMTSEHASLRFGFGNGAGAVDGSAGFGLHSDYRVGEGGANPLLGLASGGGYMSARIAVAPRLAIGFGTTQRRDLRDLRLLGLANGSGVAGIRTYQAAAQQVSVHYSPSGRLTLHGSITALRERNAALGSQSLDPADLRGGSTTTGATLGFDLAVGDTLLLSGSGTVGSTRLGRAQLQTQGLGLVTTAAELALTKRGLFGQRDRLRLAVSRPLQVTAGRLRYSSVAVVDRQTGELGVVTQALDPAQGGQPLAGEVLYGRRLGLLGQVSLFGRAQRYAGAAADPAIPAVGYAGGIQLNYGF